MILGMTDDMFCRYCERIRTITSFDTEAEYEAYLHEQALIQEELHYRELEEIRKADEQYDLLFGQLDEEPK